MELQFILFSFFYVNLNICATPVSLQQKQLKRYELCKRNEKYDMYCSFFKGSVQTLPCDKQTRRGFCD